MKLQSKPIKSKQLLTAIGTQLSQEGIEFYVLYHSILNTGWISKHLLALTIEEYIEKIYNGYSFNRFRDLGECISVMTRDKKNSDLMFTTGGIPITNIKLRNVFDVIESKLPNGMSLTVTSLRQTYFYNLWLKTHDIDLVRREAGRRTVRETYEYIDVPYYDFIPSPNSQDCLLASHFAPDALERIDKFTQKQKKLISSLQKGGTMDNKQADALYELLETVLQKLDEYETFIN